MSALHKKIMEYRNDGGDPRIAAMVWDLAERTQHATQMFNTLVTQMNQMFEMMNQLAQVMHVQGKAIEVVPEIRHAVRRASAMGMDMGNDPHLTGESDAR